MKKIILFFITILLGVSLSAQSGDGLTPGTAYYGTITTTRQWTLAYNGGTIYVGQSAGNEDLTIGSGGRLTIDPGVNVVFCTQTSDLIITSSGQLTSGGTGSPVTFTRYFPTYNYWGHISFTSTAGVSSLNNCIIEYGDVTRNTAPTSYGGGIYIDINNLNIINCTLRNNRAEWGGGIFVSQNRNPVISNSFIQNNFSNQGGGGIYLWNSTRSLIQNCVFDSNHCIGAAAELYSGGGLASQSSGSNRVINCTFVNNTSNRTQGQSILLYSSANDVITNCILWGPGSQVFRSGTNTITYCAVQGTAPSGTGNFVLNSSNTAVNGPNFVDPTNSNFALTALSPCRNTGISTGVPTTDILGKNRIAPFDIGAYEFLSIMWRLTAATTDWTNAANWDGGVPVSGYDVTIPTGAVNYPTNTPGPDFTVGTGSSLTLGPGAKATLGTFVNNGSLTLQSDAASGCASFIAGAYSGNDATVELFLTGGEASGAGTKTFRWHYISTPVTSLPVSTFAPTYTQNVAKYYDDRVSGTLNTGWVAYDGYIYTTGTIDPVRQFSSLTPGTGYDYYDSQDDKYTFAGQLNTSDVTMSLSYAAPDALHGFNLLGNPFSSGLDWSAISSDPSFPASTSKTVYFTRDNTQCSFVGGVGIPSDVTGIIPPMQGFFVKTYSAGNSLKIPASARVQNAIHSRYKGEVIVPLVRLAITENLVTDETVVRFDAAAKSDVDFDFDAIKMFISTTSTQIYSSLGGTNYSINGLPFPEPSIEIPIVVNFLTTGNQSINATQVQGLDNYTVTLTDKSTGFVADLKTTPVITFSATAGTIADRFVLKIGTITTGTEDPLNTNGTFNIYPSFGSVNIQTLADDWDGKTGSVKVQDLTGKVVGTMNNTTFSKNSLVIVPANFTKGIYLVELKAGFKRYVGKVVVR